MDLNKLFDLSYLFQTFPVSGFSWPMRIILLALFVGAIALAIYARSKMKEKGLRKKVWQKLEVWGWTSGLLGLFLMFLREVRALYISSRGYLLIFLVLMLVWLVFIIKFAKTKVPDKEELDRKEKEFDKWLPKKNK